MIALWVATAYLVKHNSHKAASLITALPATFMSAVSLTYILMAPEGFKLSSAIGYPAGITFAVCLFVLYLILSLRKKAGINSGV
jgi:carbon starvation protein CstA